MQVSRVAEMLNFFLVTLADPVKRKSLRVANPGHIQHQLLPYELKVLYVQRNTTTTQRNYC